MSVIAETEEVVFEPSDAFGFCCSDPEVRYFLRKELWNFNPNPYSPTAPLSGWGLFAAARLRFSDRRCISLKFHQH